MIPREKMEGSGTPQGQSLAMKQAKVFYLKTSVVILFASEKFQKDFTFLHRKESFKYLKTS